MSFDVCISFFFILLHSFYYSVSLPLPTVHKGIIVNDLILYSEPAMYTPVELRGFYRKRRGADSVPFTQPLRISITAHHRTFNLSLRPASNIFADDVIFLTSSGTIDFDVNNVFVGIVEDEENSSVQGIVTKDGLFDGTIISHGETFYIEPISRYANNSLNRVPPHVHTVIYKTSDVRPPPALSQTCASHELHLRTKRSHRTNFPSLPPFESNIWRSSIHDRKHLSEPKDVKDRAVYKMPNSSVLQQNLINRPRVLITKDINYERDFDDGLINGTLRHMNKRATIDPKKTTCMLYLQADHLFFQKYGTEEACIEVMTRHVQRVNAIYKATDFNQDGKNDNISFMIKRIKVHTFESTNEPGYRFPGNYGVEKFLEIFSEEDYDAFCLAYMFTYRDFEMGTLGLAWTGDLKNAGGVCEKNGHYRGSLKSLNTGIVTLLNYGKHVPPAVSHVTLAHEIGHNFGSPHDPEMCTPGGEDGNYIMFARATSGDKKNNNKFSPCSLNSINPVLNSKARNHMGCFTEPQESICGNGVVEPGEDCDCGWEEDCRDQCCYPQRRYPPPGEPPCRLTPRSICSPSQGPCCTSTCQLRHGDKCRDDNGCRSSSYCDGRTAVCPPSRSKPNKTVCSGEFVCYMGECTGSICLAYGLESCQCIPGPNDPPTKACELCCKKPGDDQPCLSSFEWNEIPYDIPDMFSKPGTPCNDYNGYCDVFQKCREVDPSGPLATLRKLLLSEESFASFKKWLAGHWYALLILATVIVLILVVSLKAFSKQKSAKTKSLTIMHSATTETVRLPPEGDGGVTVHPPAVRSKLPMHKKVREKKLHTKVPMRRKKKEPSSKENSKALEVETSKANKNRHSNLEQLATCATSEGASGKQDEQSKNTTTKIISNRLKRTNRVSTEIASDGAKKSKKVPKSSVKKNMSPVKRKKRKEMIKYQNTISKGQLPCEDPLGKVQTWLMQSISSSGKSGETFGIMTLTLPKSKSSPVGLSGFSDAPKKVIHKNKVVHIPKMSHPRSKSSGNLQQKHVKSGDDEKVKLQVLYRPPFKFSVKKISNTTASHSRKRSPTKSKHASTSKPSSRRDAILVQMPVDEIDSNMHTVPSDLDVLLSESEFLFSDA